MSTEPVHTGYPGLDEFANRGPNRLGEAEVLVQDATRHDRVEYRSRLCDDSAQIA